MVTAINAWACGFNACACLHFLTTGNTRMVAFHLILTFISGIVMTLCINDS